ncbi:MAG: ABC transporter ATP-binding protein [Polyangiaceae bacterium]|nr:ABC transporter ATP-binding protein [Polyangiaceae bacterium]
MNEAQAAPAASPEAAAGGKPIVRIEHVGKTYFRDKERVEVLKDLNLTVPEGSFDALMGPSGSGKTTLLNLIAGLDQPSEGRVLVTDVDVGRMGDSERAAWRSRTIGFVFQTYNLMPVLTARENVELPLLLTRLSASERKKRALTALRVVGLEGRDDHYPRQLSGGQEQRVAIARAIINDPQIIVADEPTGDLDRKSADDILDLLGKLNKEFKKTIVMVTHDPAAAERASVIHRLDKGRLA